MLGKYVLANHALRDKSVICFYFTSGATSPNNEQLLTSLSAAYQVTLDTI